jgi:regulatory protein|tara:strand:- start:2150 stop:2602 length:453 start_codon:yes stop_codon:yes gene_type:complete
MEEDRKWERQVALARDRGVRLLGQREHSARQLTTKLCKKGFNPDAVDEAVGQLAEMDIQSDERFAEAMVRRRVDRGFGPMYVRAELRECGIGDDAIDAVLMRSGEFWLEVASSAREKKFGSLEEADWNVQARFLARRGFPADLIYRALGR